MDRRGFLGSMLVLGASPAIVRAQSLMKVRGVVIPTLHETMFYTMSIEEFSQFFVFPAVSQIAADIAESIDNYYFRGREMRIYNEIA